MRSTRLRVIRGRQPGAEQRRGDGRDHLWQEKAAVLRAGQAVVRRAGQDRARRREGDERDPLDQPSRADSADLARGWALTSRIASSRVTSPASGRSAGPGPRLTCPPGPTCSAGREAWATACRGCRSPGAGGVRRCWRPASPGCPRARRGRGAARPGPARAQRSTGRPRSASRGRLRDRAAGRSRWSPSQVLTNDCTSSSGIGPAWSPGRAPTTARSCPTAYHAVTI